MDGKISVGLYDNQLLIKAPYVNPPGKRSYINQSVNNLGGVRNYQKNLNNNVLSPGSNVSGNDVYDQNGYKLKNMHLNKPGGNRESKKQNINSY